MDTFWSESGKIKAEMRGPKNAIIMEGFLSLSSTAFFCND